MPPRPPPPPLFPESVPLRQARAEFFAANDFGEDGNYDVTWVKLKSKPFPLYFPNSKGRVRAVRLHDLHHIVSGYRTTWVGEAEIAAWEIASSCERHYHAWALNLGAFSLGLVMCPRRLYRAFIRGRHTGNLYREEFSEALLDQPVGDLRARLRLDEPTPGTTPLDAAWFTLWAIVGASLLLLPGLIVAAALVLVVKART